MKSFIFILLFLLPVVSALELPEGVQKIVAYQQEVATSLTFLGVFIAGMITLLSPCGFVLLPVYFSFAFTKKGAFARLCFFSLGMMLAFAVFGVLAGILGDFFNPYKEFFAVIAGVVLIVLGVLLFLNKGFGGVHIAVKQQGFFGVFLLGFAFAVGWTPCVGPVLAGVITLSAIAGSVLKSTLLLITYSLGAVIPLFIITFFVEKKDLLERLHGRPHVFTLFGRTITTFTYNIVGAVLLFLVGILMVFDKGTGFFMREIPKVLPWTMDTFTLSNEFIVDSVFFRSLTAQVLGVLLVIGFFVLVVWSAYQTKSRY